jgi:hypothetical protein
MNVDQRYAASFEPNLYHDSWLMPGITFTDKYQTGPAGGYYVHKYKKEDTIVPGKPGRDFAHELAEDDLVPILLNNNFMKSRKLYDVQMNAIEARAAEELMADTTKLAQESINGSALAALVTEAKTFGETGSVDKDSIKDAILSVMDIHIFRYKQAIVRCIQLNGTDGLCYFTQFYRLGTIE